MHGGSVAFTNEIRKNWLMSEVKLYELCMYHIFYSQF